MVNKLINMISDFKNFVSTGTKKLVNFLLSPPKKQTRISSTLSAEVKSTLSKLKDTRDKASSGQKRYLSRLENDLLSMLKTGNENEIKKAVVKLKEYQKIIVEGKSNGNKKKV